MEHDKDTECTEEETTKETEEAEEVTDGDAGDDDELSPDLVDSMKSWLGTVGGTVSSTVSGLVSQVGANRAWAPAVDAYVTEDELVVLADLPGLSSDTLKVDPTPLSLSLSGSVPDEDCEEAVEYIQRCRPKGPFELHLELAAEIKHGSVSAKLKKGVLEVRAPLAVVEKPTVTVIQEDDPDE